MRAWFWVGEGLHGPPAGAPLRCAPTTNPRAGACGAVRRNVARVIGRERFFFPGLGYSS
jgi:hypothetical protein